MAKYSRVDLTGMTKLKLKKVCAEPGINVTFDQTMSQPDLVDLILKAQEGGGSTTASTAASATPADARGNVSVMSGASSQEYAIAGMSVAQARQQLAAPMNIGREAEARVNGTPVAASYVLQKDDNLEFVKKSGKKGY